MFLVNPILIIRDNADFDGAFTTVLDSNSIAFDMREMQTGKGQVCCLNITDSYIDWKAQNITMDKNNVFVYICNFIG